MTDIKVSFPKPCDEDWQSMAPQGCNRHCAACDTVVHDLSAMTLEEAEALIDSGSKACVRAQLGPDGQVKLKGGAGRKMVAAASMGLALAACQTWPEGTNGPRNSISGQIDSGWRGIEIMVEASDGRQYKTRPDRYGYFRFDGLYPSVYSLQIDPNSCAKYPDVEPIALRGGDVDLGLLEADSHCIIIGKIERTDDDEERHA